MVKSAFTGSFFQPYLAMKGHNRACGATGGVNKVVWGYILLPTSTSARAMVLAYCGCFCQLLNKWLSYLCLLTAITHPPLTVGIKKGTFCNCTTVLCSKTTMRTTQNNKFYYSNYRYCNVWYNNL